MVARRLALSNSARRFCRGTAAYCVGANSTRFGYACCCAKSRVRCARVSSRLPWASSQRALSVAAKCPIATIIAGMIAVAYIHRQAKTSGMFFKTSQPTAVPVIAPTAWNLKRCQHQTCPGAAGNALGNNQVGGRIVAAECDAQPEQKDDQPDIAGTGHQQREEHDKNNDLDDEHDRRPK